MKKTILLLIAVAVSIFTVQAQNDFNFYGFRNVAQSINLNPAIMPQSNFTLGSGIYLNYENRGFTPGDILAKSIPMDSVIPYLLNNKNKNLDNIYLNNVNDLLFMGFRIKNSYFHFGLQSHADFNVGVSKNFLSFLNYDAANRNLNQSLDLGSTKTNFNSYLSVNFGVMHEFRHKLSIGFTYKYLVGLANVTFDHNNTSLLTSVGTGINPREITLKSDALIQTSGFGNVISLYTDKRDYYKQLFASTGQSSLSADSAAQAFIKNHQDSLIKAYSKDFINNYSRGYGIDIGFQYKFSRRFSISGSVNDLGQITWSYAPHSFLVKNASFTYAGLDSNYYTFTGNQFIKGKLDSILMDTFTKAFHVSENTLSYKTALNTRFNFGFQYGIDRRNRNIIGVNFMGMYRYNQFYPVYNVTFTKRFWSIMDVRVGWTGYNGTYDNIGGGFSLNLGPVQTFVFGDNFMALSDYSKLQYFNLRAGVNIQFGRNNDKDGDGIPNKKDKCRKVYGEYAYNGCPDSDHDGVEDSKDECPTIFGPKRTNGCPDKDRDGIADKNDSCVNDSGTVALHGCPDKDGDGVTDKQDACPDIAGIASLHGCPDKDGDGVQDNKDRCPDVAGKARFDGCPDTDNDGIMDSDDACPNEPGLMKFRGCPDTDKDGIPDKLDSCVNEAGTENTHGCPDTDGDGIIDRDDKCPNESGPIETMGCPPVVDPNVVVLSAEEKKVIQEAFSNLEFETGTAKIKESSFSSLDLLAELLQSKPDYKLKINGYTDNVGKAAANQKLSQNRANAIRDYLVSKSIDTTRMNAKGFGSKNPIADNKTPEGRQRNRRVEFVIVK